MWTSTLSLEPPRIFMTRLLGLVWRGAYFASFAPLRVENRPRQALPASNWVRVRTTLAGISSSDLQLVFADIDPRVAAAAQPGFGRMAPGREVVGEVIEVGEGVQHLQVGNRVVLQYPFNCRAAGLRPLCRSCSSGNYALCEQISFPDPQPVGGGWSEELLLPEQQLCRLPNSLDDEQAILLEPAAVALHAVLRRLPLAGERVLIIGAGTIGLLTIKLLRALTSQVEISVEARYPFQVEQATRMGADHIIYPQKSYQDVERVTGAQLLQGLAGNDILVGGYDTIFDTVGTKRTLHDALRWARANATLILVGNSLHAMRLDLTPIWHQEIALVGSTGHGLEEWPIGSGSLRSTYSLVVELVEQGLLRLDRLVTHRFAFNEYRQALLAASNKAESQAIKIVFDFTRTPASTVPNVRAARRQPVSARAPVTDMPTPPATKVPQQPDAPSTPPTPTPEEVAQWSLVSFDEVAATPTSLVSHASLSHSTGRSPDTTVTKRPSGALLGMEEGFLSQDDTSVHESTPDETN
ncbi:MAG TPA: alcohol dehydrogenase catalytic domain-containing protein [Ktedonobacteraceae bacterium]|nr:alcohol dehydrogenase catalytic domain-containing protein [Ktedonobacteraceae bacterium]